MSRLSEAALADLRARNPVATVAEKFGVRLRASGRKMVGACPICGGNDAKSGRFECKTSETWVCAVCQDGGDVIRLVERVQGVDFRAAVAWLGGVQEIDPAEAKRIAREQADKQAKRDAASARNREVERQRLFATWRGAGSSEHSLVADYLRARKVLLAYRSVRYRDALDYYHGTAEDERGRRVPRSIHRGPAMLAPILGPDGRFAGLHMTYLDPRGRKAAIIDPDTGEVLSAKKVRGTLAGGHISLMVASGDEHRLVIGEGIETVGSVATVEEGDAVFDRTLYWSAISLGNLGGPHLGTLVHPTAKHGNGHAVRVPSPEPDFAGPAIRVPDTITEIVLLGDGDSDPVLTRCALQRAGARYRRPGRTIRIAMAPEGADFNAVLLSEVA